MIKLLKPFGGMWSVPIDPTKIGGSIDKLLADADLQKLKHGILFTLNTDGFVEIATSTKHPKGILLDDVIPVDGESKGILETNLVNALFGGGIVEVSIDKLVGGATSVNAGVALYAGANGTSSEHGLFSTSKADSAIVVAETMGKITSASATMVVRLLGGV